MKIFEANISLQVCTFLKDYFKNITSFENANQKMFEGKEQVKALENFQINV